MTNTEVDQIKIGKYRFGIVGLKRAFKEMADGHADKTDSELSGILLERLAERNYIADNVREEYRRAFLREFKKFIGEPVIDDDIEGLEIKILGAGCAVCDNLENTVMETLTAMGLAADLRSRSHGGGLPGRAEGPSRSVPVTVAPDPMR